MKTLNTFTTAQKVAALVVLGIFVVAVALAKLNMAGFTSTQFSF